MTDAAQRCKHRVCHFVKVDELSSQQNEMLSGREHFSEISGGDDDAQLLSEIFLS